MNVCGQILSNVRLKHNVSVNKMEELLGVSRKTISKWESGETEPTVSQAIEWFQVLDESPMPYLMAYMYPDDIYPCGTSKKDKAKVALHNRINHLTEADCEKLLFVLNGNSGSSPKALLNLITAYCHLPLMFKVLASKALLADYNTAASLDILLKPNEATADIDFLTKIIIQASEALTNGKETYL